jgi:lipid-binding SYLF domain-containing protein
MVCDQDIQPAESLYGRVNQFACSFRSFEIAGDGGAVGFSTISDKLLGRRRGILVIEQHLRAGFDKHFHGSRADAARAASDERNFAV